MMQRTAASGKGVQLMAIVPRRPASRHAYVPAVFAVLGALISGFFCLDQAAALVYRTSEGTLKDNFVVWHNGTFYLFAMYRFEEKGSEQEQWRNVWLATSTDGVHWNDVGPVIKDAPFGIYAMRVWRVGARFLLNHGSFTGNAQDVLRLWASDNLVHWEYLGPEYDVRRPDGRRIDHMDVIPVEESGGTVYYGYAVGGMLRSEDGLKWTWISELPLTDHMSVRVVEEPGGCQRIGDQYYLLVGGFYPGSFEYAVGTFIADRPEGPFRPDYAAFRLNGYSGRDLVALWAGYCRTPESLLLTNYMLDPGGRYWWHAPLKAAVVGGAGHLRMGYWKGNEALKGAPLPCEHGPLELASPKMHGNVAVSADGFAIAAPARPHIRWITPDEPNMAFGFLDAAIDVDKGSVVEGSIRVSGTNALVFPAAGVCLEQDNREATAIVFGAWGETLIGRLTWSNQPHFEVRDRTGFGCATVAGIPAGETCQYRLLIRRGIFEIYLNDLFVQTYSAQALTGRIGFFVQDGEAAFRVPQIWEMTLP